MPRWRGGQAHRGEQRDQVHLDHADAVAHRLREVVAVAVGHGQAVVEEGQVELARLQRARDALVVLGGEEVRRGRRMPPRGRVVRAVLGLEERRPSSSAGSDQRPRRSFLLPAGPRRPGAPWSPAGRAAPARPRASMPNTAASRSSAITRRPRRDGLAGRVSPAAAPARGSACATPRSRKSISGSSSSLNPHAVEGGRDVLAEPLPRRRPGTCTGNGSPRAPGRGRAPWRHTSP